jgi:hypothetical protein
MTRLVTAAAADSDTDTSSAANCRRVARRISRTAFSACSECVSVFDLISTPLGIKMSLKLSLPQSPLSVQLVLTGNTPRAKPQRPAAAFQGQPATHSAGVRLLRRDVHETEGPAASRSADGLLLAALLRPPAELVVAQRPPARLHSKQTVHVNRFSRNHFERVILKMC